jgi:hypothetical protein
MNSLRELLANNKATFATELANSISVLEAVIWQASATRNSSVVILKGPIFCE